MFNVTTTTKPAIITDHDMRDQVREALADVVAEYSVSEIVGALQASFGTVDVDTIPGEIFWDVVYDNRLTES